MNDVKPKAPAANTQELLPAPAQPVLLGTPDLTASPRPLGAKNFNAEGLQRSIAEAAYFRAQCRGFEPGRDLDDWLAAEQEIRDLGAAAT